MDYSQYYTRRSNTFRIGKVTKYLIITCVIVFFLLPASLYDYLMFNSENLINYPWIIITNAFLHGSFFHLLFNMFTLYMFGSLIELKHGSKFFIILFTLSVIFSNLMFGFFEPGVYGLGISGFVYALIGSAVILEPKTRVLIPIGFFFTTAPVKIAGPLLFFGELIFSFLGPDGIGHVAHAVGFLVGLGLAYFRKKNQPPWYEYYSKYL